MVKKIKITTNSIQYLAIRDLVFNYQTPDTIQSFEPGPETFHFKLEIVKTFSLEQKTIRLIFSIHLRTEADNKKEAKCLYTTEHLFKVSNFKDLVKETDDHFEIDDLLNNTITGLAYSTIRGSLYQKLNGTWFSQFILPITKPADLGKTIPPD